MIIFKKAVIMATIKNIKDELTKQQKENIGDILAELENEKEIIDHIIDCINECESPKGENQHKTDHFSQSGLFFLEKINH